MKEKDILIKDEGAMTVEASFIIPVILVLLMGIIYMTLFYVDMSVVKAEAMKTADYVAASWKGGGSIPEGIYDRENLLDRSVLYLANPGGSDVFSKAESHLYTALSGSLFVTKPQSVSVNASLYKVTVLVSISFPWPASVLGQYFGDGLKFHGESEISMDDREELFRMIGGETN